LCTFGPIPLDPYLYIFRIMKYIVTKGWEGFADRLQCLSYAVTTSLRYNRTLYVDWNDDIWGTGFYKYFTFRDLPHITSDAEIPKGATVHPGFWKHKLMLPDNAWVYDMRDQLEFDCSTTTEFADVWVQCGIGFREYNMPLLCKHLVVNDDIIPQVYTEPLTDLPVVHLRGNDRCFSDGDWTRLRELAPVAYVLSDDTKLINRWMNESPGSVVMSTPMENVTHFTTNVDKHEYNIKVLRDFFILCSAKTAYALNENSIYYQMSRILGSCRQYKSLFNMHS
jgi:hypothetical protein